MFLSKKCEKSNMMVNYAENAMSVVGASIDFSIFSIIIL